MPRKRFTSEQIIGKLREAEVGLAKGKQVAVVCKQLLEAKVLIERWRRQYNQVRPHSSLNYRPPAPETRVPWPELHAKEPWDLQNMAPILT